VRTESEKTKLKWFLGGLFVIALVTNSILFRPGSTRTPPQPNRQEFISRQPQAPQPPIETANELAARKTADDEAAALKAAQVAATRHQQFLARYLNTDHARKPGAKTMALAVVSEAGKFNPAVSGAISARFKPEGADIVPSLFTPEFVSDGLFAKAFDDPSPILKKLELAS